MNPHSLPNSFVPIEFLWREHRNLATAKRDEYRLSRLFSPALNDRVNQTLKTFSTPMTAWGRGSS